jgi:hypothetical protein
MIRKSKQHPELLVSNTGNIYRAETGQRINISQNHCYARGSVIAYKNNGRHKTLSVAKLVCETFIKELDRDEYISFKDGNETNITVDNIEIFKVQKSNRGRKPKRKESDETYSTWMNGHEELYC